MDVATHEYTSWTHGTLVFNRTPLRDVLAELARAYGVRIQVDDSVLTRRPVILEVAVQRQSLPQVLDLIGFAMNTHYLQRDRVYHVFDGRRAPRLRNSEERPQPEKQYGR
jgi:type II secretory pathway component GspD/PulD (secretin)